MGSVTAAIELLLQLINAAGPVSAAIRAAHAEGRELTEEELRDAFDADNTARDALVASIERAQAEARS